MTLALIGLLFTSGVLFTLLSSNDSQQTTSQQVVEGSDDDIIETIIENQSGLSADDLYVSSFGASTSSANQLEQLEDGRFEAIDFIANTPMGNWLIKDLEIASLPEQVSSASDQDKVPIFVFYNIPNLGCGGGGAANLADYKNWVDSIVREIDTLDDLIVVIEPDAIPLIDCLEGQEYQDRIEALSYAAQQLNTKTNAKVYLDAGHSDWKTVDFTEEVIKEVGLANLDGFSLNVSNFQPNVDLITFGDELAGRINIPYIIDTSRNGNPAIDLTEWCNAPGAALGKLPTFETSSDSEFLDAYLWIKVPGESDADCNGGPTEGQWWLEYAADLYYNSNYDD